MSDGLFAELTAESGVQIVTCNYFVVYWRQWRVVVSANVVGTSSPAGVEMLRWVGICLSDSPLAHNSKTTG